MLVLAPRLVHISVGGFAPGFVSDGPLPPAAFIKLGGTDGGRGQCARSSALKALRGRSQREALVLPLDRPYWILPMCIQLAFQFDVRSFRLRTALDAARNR